MTENFPTATDTLSAECTVAKQKGYGDLHRECRQTEDVPLPHSARLLLAHCCGCACHVQTRSGARP
jgi:hypothetical protein